MSQQNGYISRLNSASKKVEYDERYMGFDWSLDQGSLSGQIVVSGVVELSRVKYGGRVCHTIKLESPINVYGSVRDRCIVQHEDVTQLKEINNA